MRRPGHDDVMTQDGVGQGEKLQRALEVAGLDLVRTVDRVQDMRVTTGPVMVWYGVSGVSIYWQDRNDCQIAWPGVAQEKASLVAGVANSLSELVGNDLHRTWPSRPIHGGEPFARVLDGEAIWYCEEGDHQIAHVGDLEPDPPGPPVPLWPWADGRTPGGE